MFTLSKVVNYLLLVLVILLAAPVVLGQNSMAGPQNGGWYRHPMGIYRIPLPKDWKLFRGFRGKVEDHDFDTLVDPTSKHWILCCRNSEQVGDELTALEKFQRESLAELDACPDVQTTGLTVKGVPMIILTCQPGADRIVSRLAAVKNGHRIIIHIICPPDAVSRQLPALVDDVLMRLEFPDQVIPPDESNPGNSLPGNQPVSAVDDFTYPPSRVVETGRKTIGPGGGSLQMRDGLLVNIPPGAVLAETDFLVERLDPEILGDNWSNYQLLNCVASVPRFERPVEIRLAVDGRAPRELPFVVAGTLNDTTGIVELCPVRLESNGSSTELVMTTDHFCGVVLPTVEELLDQLEPSPSSAEPIEVGIYKQGDTEFCWAITMQAQARAYAPGLESVYKILGEIGLDSVGSAGIRSRPVISQWIQNHSGKQPIRLYWGVSRFSGSDVWLENLKSYIRREVGKNGRPVFLGRNLWSGGHAVLIVGYDDQGNFIVHDPKNTPDFYHPPGAMGYYKASAKDLGIDWGLPGDSFVTMTIPGTLNPSRSLTTLNIPHRAVWFSNPGVPNAFVFGWTESNAEGYEWRIADRFYYSGDKHDGPLPPSIEAIHLGEPNNPKTGLEVINSSRTESRQVIVEIEVGKDGEPPRHREQQTISVAPNRRQAVNAVIPVKLFRRPEDADLTKYRLRARLRQDGVVVDRASIAFEIGAGRWFSMNKKGVQFEKTPLFAKGMVPDRIFWCDPETPQASGTQLTLNYVSSVEGRAPLSAGNQPGVASQITLRAVREGDEYVVRGAELDKIAWQSEFFWQHLVGTLVSDIGSVTANADLNLDERLRKKATAEALRQKLEKTQITVAGVEFRFRQVGELLHLRVIGNVTSTRQGEAPVKSDADLQVVGDAEQSPLP